MICSTASSLHASYHEKYFTLPESTTKTTETPETSFGWIILLWASGVSRCR
jgi:hypothetical protein